VSGSGDNAGSTGAYRLIVSPGLAGVAYRPDPGIYFQVDILRTDLELIGGEWRIVHGKNAIDPTKRTWVVIHGRKNSRDSDSITNATQELLLKQPGDQVLTLDWSQGAYAENTFDFDGEDAIQSVGIWAASALSGAGFTGLQLNLVGHSWGSYVADELAERMPGGVNTIVALDAAENAAFGYDPEDPDQVNFARDSVFSWAFHSSTLGSGESPTTADEAFVVTGGRDALNAHSDVVFLFAYLLDHPNDVIGQYFLLSRLLSATLGPWLPNQFYTQFAGEARTGGYEAQIVSDSSGRIPTTLYYVPLESGPSINITKSENKLVLSWPTGSTGFGLESTPLVPAATWTPVLPAPVIVNGQYTVTNAIVGAARIYRLRKP
jgi:pimeloyl-ACP methyl ester carboxylesterase